MQTYKWFLLLANYHINGIKTGIENYQINNFEKRKTKISSESLQ